LLKRSASGNDLTSQNALFIETVLESYFLLYKRNSKTLVFDVNGL